MKKTLFIFPLIFLSIMGLLANAIYYYQSFIQSGYISILAFIMLICFLGLEYILYLYKVKNGWLRLLKVSVIIFSILITLSAQFFATSQDEIKSKKSLNNSSIILRQIENNELEIKQLNEQIINYSKQHWVNTKDAREDAQQRKDFLTNKNLELYETITSEEAIIEIAKSTYTYYAEILKCNSEGIRIWFQLFSSILLALISPVSLSLIHTVKLKSEIKIVPKVEQEKKSVDPNKIKHVAQIVQMLLLKHNQTKQIYKPLEAYEKFQLMKNNPNVFKHTLQEIEDVYSIMIKKNLLNKSYDNIKKGVLNEIQKV